MSTTAINRADAIITAPDAHSITSNWSEETGVTSILWHARHLGWAITHTTADGREAREPEFAATAAEAYSAWAAVYQREADALTTGGPMTGDGDQVRAWLVERAGQWLDIAAEATHCHRCGPDEGTDLPTATTAAFIALVYPPTHLRGPDDTPDLVGMRDLATDRLRDAIRGLGVNRSTAPGMVIVDGVIPTDVRDSYRETEHRLLAVLEGAGLGQVQIIAHGPTREAAEAEWRPIFHDWSEHRRALAEALDRDRRRREN